jgi:hypothetical protein
MTAARPMLAQHVSTIEIGGMPIAIRTNNTRFVNLLEERYAGFMEPASSAGLEFDVELYDPAEPDTDGELEVTFTGGEWRLQRGDFRARWDPRTRNGHIRQSCNPYAVDSVLRILHSLILARQGGFLVHAASAIRGGKAFIFSGVSGAGKTTISRLAPPDATLLTDEVSYVRRKGSRYFACGTPFSGELNRAGENCSAPVATLFFLEKGPQNSIEPISSTEAVQRLMRNILFFAHDPELVKLVFQSACEFASLVPMRRLVFVPEAQVWDSIH